VAVWQLPLPWGHITSCESAGPVVGITSAKKRTLWRVSLFTKFILHIKLRGRVFACLSWGLDLRLWRGDCKGYCLMTPDTRLTYTCHCSQSTCYLSTKWRHITHRFFTAFQPFCYLELAVMQISAMFTQGKRNEEWLEERRKIGQRGREGNEDSRIAHSAYRIATGWKVRWSNPVVRRFSRNRPDGPWAYRASYNRPLLLVPRLKKE
jgi:hypothetical protein